MKTGWVVMKTVPNGANEGWELPEMKDEVAQPMSPNMDETNEAMNKPHNELNEANGWTAMNLLAENEGFKRMRIWTMKARVV